MPRVLSTTDISDFQDRLCDAAEKLFAEHGLEAVTMRQLAGALGVSPMTPYRYFADKHAILAAVRTRAFDRHAEVMEAAYHASANGPTTRSEALGAAYIRFALENPEAYKLMFDIRQPNEKEYPDFVRAAARSRATMTRHLLDRQEHGTFEGDVELVGHMYWAALHGPIMLQLSGLLPPKLDAGTLAQSIAIAMDAGLSRKPKPA